jgi:hypothetical protein
MNQHAGMVTAWSFAGIGTWLASAEPILASLSYIAALIAAVVTIYYKIRNKGQ